MSTLSWDAFRTVLAIANHEGLVGAAGALGVNHSTVFRRLGEIERQVGCALFKRSKGGYTATVEGEEMIASGRAMAMTAAAFTPRRDRREAA